MMWLWLRLLLLRIEHHLLICPLSKLLLLLLLSSIVISVMRERGLLMRSKIRRKIRIKWSRLGRWRPLRVYTGARKGLLRVGVWWMVVAHVDLWLGRLVGVV